MFVRFWNVLSGREGYFENAHDISASFMRYLIPKRPTMTPLKILDNFELSSALLKFTEAPPFLSSWFQWCTCTTIKLFFSSDNGGIKLKPSFDLWCYFFFGHGLKHHPPSNPCSLTQCCCIILGHFFSNMHDLYVWYKCEQYNQQISEHCVEWIRLWKIYEIGHSGNYFLAFFSPPAYNSLKNQ